MMSDVDDEFAGMMLPLMVWLAVSAGVGLLSVAMMV